MSRFTEEDRERIRSELVDAGRELFAEYGFERTRVSDVTEAVGIGTSTFYGFFDSKETLYAEVLRGERDRLESHLEEAVAAADSPKAEIRALLETMFEEVHANPLISRLIVEGELRELQQQLSASERRSITETDRDRALTNADRWAAMEEFRYDDPELIRGLFRSLIFVTRSQDALIGSDHAAPYEEVEDRLIETIVDGLFVEPVEDS